MVPNIPKVYSFDYNILLPRFSDLYSGSFSTRFTPVTPAISTLTLITDTLALIVDSLVDTHLEFLGLESRLQMVDLLFDNHSIKVLIILEAERLMVDLLSDSHFIEFPNPKVGLLMVDLLSGSHFI